MRAAAPTLEHLHPAGVAAGSSNTVELVGKFDPWPPRVWVDAPGLEFVAQTNQGRFAVLVAGDVQPGTRLMRVYNQEGASEPRPLVIATGEELIEAEPNDHFAAPQLLETLPISINGRLDKRGDVDSFAVRMLDGERLEARVDSYVLMSGVDAVLRLITTNGLQLAWNHDGPTPDPRLIWRAAEDQVVVVQVFGFAYPATADIRLTGGDGAVYRLHLGMLAAPSPDPVRGDGVTNPPALVDLPYHGKGAIAVAGDVQRVRFRPRKDDVILATVHAETLGSPLDAWLRIEDPEGKELAVNDDAEGSWDPVLEWKAPADGEFALAVGSRTRRAGADHRYELDLRQATPEFEALALASSVVLKPGETNELKLKVSRLRGFSHDLKVTARDLPEGVVCEALSVSEKGGEMSLRLSAGADAMPHSGAFRVMIHDETGNCERLVPFSLTGGTVDNGVPGGYRALLADKTERLWLTVLEPKAEPAKVEGKD